MSGSRLLVQRPSRSGVGTRSTTHGSEALRRIQTWLPTSSTSGITLSPYVSSGNHSGASGYRPGGAAGSSIGFNIDAAGTSTAISWNWVAVEIRSGEIAYTTLFFAVSCVLIFAFALVRDGRAPEDGAAGLLWIAIAFAGTLALGRTFERERQAETLRALLMAPTARPAVYVGKLLGIVALLAGVEVVLA